MLPPPQKYSCWTYTQQHAFKAGRLDGRTPQTTCMRSLVQEFRDGNIMMKSDGSIADTQKVLSIAFPGDRCQIGEHHKSYNYFTLMEDGNMDRWIMSNDNKGLPTVSVFDFIREIDGGSVKSSLIEQLSQGKILMEMGSYEDTKKIIDKAYPRDPIPFSPIHLEDGKYIGTWIDTPNTWIIYDDKEAGMPRLPIIPILQFLDELNENKVMITTTRNVLLAALHVSDCATWQTAIKNRLKENYMKKDDAPIDVTDLLQRASREGDENQRSWLVSQGLLKGVDFSTAPNIMLDGKIVIGNRFSGDFKDKGLWLSSKYSWRIVEDNDGHKVLLPTIN